MKKVFYGVVTSVITALVLAAIWKFPAILGAAGRVIQWGWWWLTSTASIPVWWMLLSSAAIVSVVVFSGRKIWIR